jgi:hypothetical protein
MRGRTLLLALALVPLVAACTTTDKCEGPCLPLHTVEGMSGHFSVPSAYFANLPPEGEVVARPSVGATHVHLGHGKHLEAFSITGNLWGRVELGYAFDLLDVGDSYEAIGGAFGIRPGGHSVRMHNLNLRGQVVKDGDFDLSWMPAVTLGVHYKSNADFEDLDDDLAPIGGLDPLGLEDDDGIDVTLYATKMLTFLPRPGVVTLGLRSTEAAHLGLLGFTGERKIVVEGAVCYLLTDDIALAGEYRQKPDEYESIRNVLEGEDDWWVLAAAYLPSDRVSVALGYGHFGQLLNHEANSSWGIAVKLEF